MGEFLQRIDPSGLPQIICRHKQHEPGCRTRREAAERDEGPGLARTTLLGEDHLLDGGEVTGLEAIEIDAARQAARVE